MPCDQRPRWVLSVGGTVPGCAGAVRDCAGLGCQYCDNCMGLLAAMSDSQGGESKRIDSCSGVTVSY